jgi:hypothetical protein
MFPAENIFRRSKNAHATNPAFITFKSAYAESKPFRAGAKDYAREIYNENKKT